MLMLKPGLRHQRSVCTFDNYIMPLAAAPCCSLSMPPLVVKLESLSFYDGFPAV